VEDVRSAWVAGMFKDNCFELIWVIERMSWSRGRDLIYLQFDACFGSLYTVARDGFFHIATLSTFRVAELCHPVTLGWGRAEETCPIPHVTPAFPSVSCESF
jgi:hypothetical protein